MSGKKGHFYDDFYDYHFVAVIRTKIFPFDFDKYLLKWLKRPLFYDRLTTPVSEKDDKNPSS